MLLATAVPGIIPGPLAGALVDRWDRRWAMILSDTGAAAGTLVIAALHFTDTLEIWHLYPALALSAAFATFQYPAYSAATSLLVSKNQYGRASVVIALGALAYRPLRTLEETMPDAIPDPPDRRPAGIAAGFR